MGCNKDKPPAKRKPGNYVCRNANQSPKKKKQLCKPKKIKKAESKLRALTTRAPQKTMRRCWRGRAHSGGPAQGMGSTLQPHVSTEFPKVRLGPPYT